MAAILDHAHAGDVHIAHHVGIAAEDPAIDQVGIDCTAQDRRLRIQHDAVIDCETGAVRRTRQHALQQGRADARRAHAAGDVAALRTQALAVFQPAQFLHRRHRDVRIGAHAPAAAGIQVIAQREQAVAEVGFGGGADRYRRAAAGDALHFGCVQVGGMHQRPARVHVRVVEQPLHRTRAAHGHAFVDFGHLLGDMDVHARLARQCRKHLAHRLRRHRAQAVQGAADAHPLACVGAQHIQQPQVGLDLMAEAALAFRQRARSEAAGHVQHRQQGNADAGVARGAQQRLRHRIGIRVWPAIRRMVQVMELADRGVAGFQHLHVQLRGHRVQQLGVEARGHRVHSFAPGPERIGGIGLALGHARHRALEGVRMQVGDAGQGPAARGASDEGCGRRVHPRIVAQTRRPLR